MINALFWMWVGAVLALTASRVIVIHRDTRPDIKPALKRSRRKRHLNIVSLLLPGGWR